MIATTSHEPLERPFDWPAIREAFINRPERQEFAELAEEFTVSERRLRRAASDEGWVVARAAYLEKQLIACDAKSAVLLAMRADATVLREFTDLALRIMLELKRCVEDVGASRNKPSGRAGILNTCGFAMANIGKALKDVGVVGIPDKLKDAAMKGNGQWDAGLLQQINVTVQNLQTQKPGNAPVDTPEKPSAAGKQPGEAVEIEAPAAPQTPGVRK